METRALKLQDSEVLDFPKTRTPPPAPRRWRNLAVFDPNSTTAALMITNQVYESLFSEETRHSKTVHDLQDERIPLLCRQTTASSFSAAVPPNKSFGETSLKLERIVRLFVMYARIRREGRTSKDFFQTSYKANNDHSNPFNYYSE